MYYTGIDFYRKTFFLTINQNGEIVKRANLQNQEKTIITCLYLNSLDDQSQIVIESTTNGY